ncbi:toxic anion resistance protein [Aquabacterium sp. A7-Y]|uniref:toxic anion resistance protein n=1 Tax=Aquabacterium sp. A7-Y TaxID=1349605 RepID=UPI00223D49C9|nr:toxic anion resistance protein [Aquabacterium sp. A7-Y]MCW7539327.1 toxic anion resistance protein [Aquabacterium sp. A7-Y]
MTSFKPKSALALDPVPAPAPAPTTAVAPAAAPYAPAQAYAPAPAFPLQAAPAMSLDQLLSEQQLGPQDAAQVKSLAERLDTSKPMTVHDLGSEAANHASKYADRILAQVKNKDLGEIGSKLSTIVVTAKSINLGALSTQRSRIPLIGGLVDRFKLGKEALIQQFQSTDKQLEKLVGEVDISQQGLRQRVQDLDQAFAATQEEFRRLSVSVAAGKLKLAELQGELNAQPEPGDVGAAQRINDLRQFAERLEKRVADLLALRMSALQTLPMIRIIQSNNQTIIEKFQNIKELTIPAWRRQFMLALSLNEQSQAVALAKNIDDATNEFLRRNAELLKQNSVETARANQRSVIDIETLEQVQQTLISTVEEVLSIQREGQAQRQDAERRIGVLQNELKAAIGRPA